MKLKFGYDVTDLTAWVNEQEGELLTKSVFAGKTAQTFEIQSGIKYISPLNYMDTEVIFRSNAGCGTFTATGNTTFTQKDIATDAIIMESAFCPNDLEDFWTRKGLSSGQYYDTMAFQTEWTNHYTNLVNKEVELMLWKGNKSTGSGNLALINGFIQVIDADTEVIDGNATGGGYTQIAASTGITVSNVITILEHQIEKLPTDVEGAEDIEIYCGWDTFKKALSAYRALNNFYIDGANANPYKTGVFTMPTWGVNIVAMRGLDGTNRIFTGRKSNFIIGTDLMNDFESFQIWYEKKDDKILTRLKARLGTQIKFGSEMVEFTLIP